MAAFGQWDYEVDRDATASAYSRACQGGANQCQCATCQNFVLVRDRVYPPGFTSLLLELGIDPSKEAEAYHLGSMDPREHQYGGWFHFVGELIKTGDFPMVEFAPGFKAWFCRAGAPHLPALDGFSLVQVEFLAERVPWALEAPEPD